MAAAWSCDSQGANCSTARSRRASSASEAGWPSRKSAAASVGKYKDGTTDMAPYLPSTPANAEKGMVNDAGFWADHGTELTERFNAWVAQ